MAVLVGVILQTVAASRGFTSDNAQKKTGMNKLLPITAGFCLYLAVAWSKISFALTLLRITTGWTKRLAMFAIITVSLAVIGSVVIHWFWCWPSYKIWTKGVPGKCLPRIAVNGYNTAAAGYSALMDFFLALLPWKIVSALRMNKKEKFGVAFAMSMGIL